MFQKRLLGHGDTQVQQRLVKPIRTAMRKLSLLTHTKLYLAPVPTFSFHRL